MNCEFWLKEKAAQIRSRPQKMVPFCRSRDVQQKKLGPAKRVSHDVKCLNMSKYVQICLNA